MATARIISNKVVLRGLVFVQGDELDDTQVPASVLDALVDAGSAEWAGATDSTPEPAADEPAIEFASESAEEHATALGLAPADFEGIEPSGKGGYTKADVEQVAASKE